MLSDLIVRFSRSWPLFLLAAALTGACLYLIIGVITPRFEAMAGSPPFDMQNALTVEQAFRQLTGYTPEVTRFYYLFSAIDFVFPLVASLFLSAIAAFSLRYLWPAGYRWMTDHGLWLLFLLPALFDWSENVWALTLVSNPDQQMATVASLMIYSKLAKLALVGLAQLLSWCLLALAALKWVVVTARARITGA